MTDWVEILLIGRSGRINTIYKVEKSKEDISGGWKDLSKSKVAEEFSGGGSGIGK